MPINLFTINDLAGNRRREPILAYRLTLAVFTAQFIWLTYPVHIVFNTRGGLGRCFSCE